MSYTPTNWKDGDVITAQRLNKIENGINNDFIINITDVEGEEKYVIDKTFNEIKEAIQSNKRPLLVYHYLIITRPVKKIYQYVSSSFYQNDPDPSDPFLDYVAFSTLDCHVSFNFTNNTYTLTGGTHDIYLIKSDNSIEYYADFFPIPDEDPSNYPSTN